MSSASINLVSTQSHEVEKKMQRLVMVRAIAIILLSSIAILSVIIFALNLSTPIASIKKQETGTLADISGLHSTEGGIFLAKDRVNNIQNIMSNRNNYSDLISQLSSNVPSGLSVDLLSIDQNKINITVSGQSLDSINKFVDYFAGLANNKKLISNVNIQNLALNSFTAKYSVSLNAVLK